MPGVSADGLLVLRSRPVWDQAWVAPSSRAKEGQTGSSLVKSAAWLDLNGVRVCDVVG